MRTRRLPLALIPLLAGIVTIGGGPSLPLASASPRVWGGVPLPPANLGLHPWDVVLAPQNPQPLATLRAQAGGQSIVLGSLASGRPLTAGQGAAAILAFYRQSMPLEGWTLREALDIHPIAVGEAGAQVWQGRGQTVRIEVYALLNHLVLRLYRGQVLLAPSFRSTTLILAHVIPSPPGSRPAIGQEDALLRTFGLVGPQVFSATQTLGVLASDPSRLAWVGSFRSVPICPNYLPGYPGTPVVCHLAPVFDIIDATTGAFIASGSP